MDNDIRRSNINTNPVASPGFNPTATPNMAPTTSAPAPMATMPTPTSAVKPPKKSKLKLFLAIFIPLAVIIGGLTAWYFLYYNNSYVAISQALNNAMQKREDTVNYDVTAETQDFQIATNGTVGYLVNGTGSGDVSINVTSNDTSLDIGKLSYVNDNNAIYLKLEPGKTIQDLLGSLSTQSNTTQPNSATDQTAPAVDNAGTTDSTSPFNRWIQIKIADLNNLTGNTTVENGQSVDFSEVTQCMQSGLEELDNKAGRQQVISSLIDTKFLVVTADGSDADGKIYSIKLDSSKLGDFYRKFYNTNYLNSMQDCLSSKGIEIEEDTLTTSTIEHDAELLNTAKFDIKVWLKGFDRQFSKLQFTSDIDSTTTSGKLNVTLKWLHKLPDVSVPENAVDIQTVFQQNQQLLTTTTSLINTTQPAANPNDLNTNVTVQETNLY